MSSLTQKDILLAFKSLRVAYKEVLQDWLRKNNKEGVKYTIRIRGEYRDSEGYSHWLEREYCPPITIEFDNQISVDKETLPFLDIPTMNKMFRRAHLGPVNWHYMAKHHTGIERLAQYISEGHFTKK